MTVAEKNEYFLNSVWFSSDGSIDLDRYLNSEYGEELMRRINIRSQIEDYPEKAKEYYNSIGIDVQTFGEEDYYTRWKLFTPINAPAGKKLPLVFYLHGGGISIEGEEYVTGILDVAAKEHFIVCIPQNTNWQEVDRLIGVVSEMCPVDAGRIYVGGFSQGSMQTHSAMYRLSEKLAGCYIAGGDIFRPFDPLEVWFTDEEYERIKKAVMPLVLLCGRCEPSCYAPLNNWHPRTTPPRTADTKPGGPDTFYHPGRDESRDPTRVHMNDYDKHMQHHKEEHSHQHLPAANGGTMRPSKGFQPAPGEDPRVWGVNKVNSRLELLDITPRDVDKCVAYADLPKNAFHHIVGVNGDAERVEEHYGVKHFVADFNDSKGRNVLRFAVVDNAPHFPPMALGQMMWSFLHRFSRNTETGALITEE